MDQQAREQTFITALATEHFALQSTRSATIGEANGRAAIYLSTVSGALVAFGFLAQLSSRLGPVVAAVLAALLIVGELTLSAWPTPRSRTWCRCSVSSASTATTAAWRPKPSSSSRPTGR